MKSRKPIPSSTEIEIEEALRRVQIMLSKRKEGQNFFWAEDSLNKILEKTENIKLLSKTKNQHLREIIKDINTEIVYCYAESISASIADFFIQTDFDPDPSEMAFMSDDITSYIKNDLLRHTDDFFNNRDKDTMMGLSYTLNRWLSVANVLYEQQNYFGVQAVMNSIAEHHMGFLHGKESIYGRMSQESQEIYDKLKPIFGTANPADIVRASNELQKKEGDKIPPGTFIAQSLIELADQSYKNMKMNLETDIARLKWIQNDIPVILTKENKRDLLRVVRENFFNNMVQMLPNYSKKIDSINDLSQFKHWFEQNKEDIKRKNINNPELIKQIESHLNEAIEKSEIIQEIPKQSVVDTKRFADDIKLHAQNSLRSACAAYNKKFASLDKAVKWISAEIASRSHIRKSVLEYVTTEKNKENYDYTDNITEEIFVTGEAAEMNEKKRTLTQQLEQLTKEKDKLFDQKNEIMNKIKELEKTTHSTSLSSSSQGKGKEKEKDSFTTKDEANLATLKELEIEYEDKVKIKKEDIAKIRIEIEKLESALNKDFVNKNDTYRNEIQAKSKKGLQQLAQQKGKEFQIFQKCDIWEINTNKYEELQGEFSQSPKIEASASTNPAPTTTTTTLASTANPTAVKGNTPKTYPKDAREKRKEIMRELKNQSEASTKETISLTSSLSENTNPTPTTTTTTQASTANPITVKGNAPKTYPKDAREKRKEIMRELKNQSQASTKETISLTSSLSESTNPTPTTTTTTQASTAQSTSNLPSANFTSIKGGNVDRSRHSSSSMRRALQEMKGEAHESIDLTRPSTIGKSGM